MKLIGKPIYPTELAPTSKVTAVETDYKASDKTLSDKNTTQDQAIAAVKTTADKAATDIAALATTVTNNKASADVGISSAIAEWDPNRPYKVNNIVIRDKTFFLCSIDNDKRDPLTDKTGSWGIFTPGSASDVFANRSPTDLDVRPVGIKWWDTSFGASTPLGFVSLGSGAWQFLNQITLSKIRFRVTGYNTTYRSELNSIQIYKADGVTPAPNNWFVWGASSGVSVPGAGSNFTGQKIGAGGNASGWADLEPSAKFDLNESISRITGSLAFANSNWIQLIYSNGGSKTFTPSGGNLALMEPPMVARYGNSIASVLGETLTAAKLTNAANLDAGRLTGAEFVAAWNQLFQAQPAVLQAYQQQTIDALTARIAALEAK